MIARELRAGLVCVTFVLASSTGLTSAQARKATGPASSTVAIESGRIDGVFEGGLYAFKGVPYAKPPVGALRWRAPEPVEAWRDVRKADHPSNACIQIPGLSAANGGDAGPLSEDCLYLNVWTPTLKSAASLPVMVWIHGGAYVFGAGGLPLYDGGPLAKKGAVIVTLNYRLAQLGFFAHPALEKSNPGGPANFGLLDQIAALKWVRSNIGKFGGDPDNVTIFGQSAGAKSVLALFASPKARGLFQKGIAQSSYVVPDATRAKALEVGAKVAEAVGLDGANATMEDLRRVPAEAFGQLKDKGLSLAPVPISGDEVLPSSIEDTFGAGKEAPVPLILGNTSDDTSVVSAFGFDPKTIFDRLGIAKVLVRSLYPKVKGDTQVARQATRDLVFTMPVRWLADRHAKRAPTWRYYFDYTAEKERGKFPDGVPHGGDIPYTLDTVNIFEGTKNVVTKRDRRFARLISDYWYQFAETGRPSATLGPAWPNHRQGQDRTMVFAEDSAVQNNFMRPRMNVFIGVTKILDAVLKRD